MSVKNQQTVRVQQSSPF